MPGKSGPSIISVSSLPAVSSSPASRRPCLKLISPEDPFPRIPWRVISLPTPALAQGGQEAAAAEEDQTFPQNEFDKGNTTTATGEHSSAGSLEPSKGISMGRTGLGLSLDDDSSHDATTTARRRMVAASWEREASLRKILQVEMPRIRVSDTDAPGSPPPVVGVAPPCDRREWSATPPIKAHRIAYRRLHPHEEVKPDKASNASVSQVREAGIAVARVPKAPPRPLCAWEVLRQRTLKVTQREPSIFRRNIQSSQGGVQPESTQPARWLILNRRIFGVREVVASRGIAFPEWLMFSQGIPPSGMDEKSRWALRLGGSGNTRFTGV